MNEARASHGTTLTWPTWGPAFSLLARASYSRRELSAGANYDFRPQQIMFGRFFLFADRVSANNGQWERVLASIEQLSSFSNFFSPARVSNFTLAKKSAPRGWRCLNPISKLARAHSSIRLSFLSNSININYTSNCSSPRARLLALAKACALAKEKSLWSRYFERSQWKLEGDVERACA